MEKDKIGQKSLVMKHNYGKKEMNVIINQLLFGIVTILSRFNRQQILLQKQLGRYDGCNQSNFWTIGNGCRRMDTS